MIMSAIVILATLIIAYIWASRGLFSALLHMACTLVAGAVAFGLWEPLTYALISHTDAAWILGAAPGFSLAFLFALTLAILRVGVDKLIPWNVDVDNVTNLVGGGLCGLVSGTVATGVLAISVSQMNVPTDFMGYRTTAYDAGGALVRSGSLLFPADRITAGLYSFMSETTLRTGTPMGEFRPDIATEGSLLRTSFNNGGAMSALRPKSFTLLGRYTVGRTANIQTKELMTDTANIQEDPAKPKAPAAAAPGGKKTAAPSPADERIFQRYKDLAGNDPTPTGNYIEGYVVQFSASAREKSGQVVVGAGQVRLVYRTPDDAESVAVQPYAAVSQHGGEDENTLGRWRFNGKEVFIPSRGGASEARMAFEFLVPANAKPLALYVKGVRVPLTDDDGNPAVAPKAEFSSTAERDARIRSKGFMAGFLVAAGVLDRAGAIPVDLTKAAPGGAELQVNNRLGGTINRDNIRGMSIDKDSRKITDAPSITFSNKDFETRGLERTLQVNAFFEGEETSMVELKVDTTSRCGLDKPVAAGADQSQAPVLIDDKGQRYVAVGYVSKDSTNTVVRFTPGKPIAAMTELPTVTVSRPDQRLTLLFWVSQGVKVQSFAIGNKVIADFTPPPELKKN